MGNISKHFDREEFECSCGCGFDTVDVVLLNALEAIRETCGPVRVTSGCRCADYNQSIGGAVNSQHKKGRAADIQLSTTSPSEVAELASQLGMSVGSYSTFTHVDSRTGVPKRW